MSSFVRALNDDELRIRQGQAFEVGQTLTGDGVNPNTFVLFNAGGAGKVIILTQWWVSFSAAAVLTFSSLNANPGVTPGNAPTNRFLGGVAAFASWQAASAAAIAVVSTIGVFNMLASVEQNLIGNAYIVIPNGFGVALTAPTAATTFRLAVAWYELPS